MRKNRKAWMALILALLMGLALCLAGCGGADVPDKGDVSEEEGADVPEEEGAKGEDAETVPEIGTLKIDLETVEDSIVVDMEEKDGVVLCEYSYMIPSVDQAACPALAEAFESYGIETKLSTETEAQEYGDMESMLDRYLEEWYEPCFVHHELQPYRADEKMVCLLETAFSYAGGAHPSTVYIDYNYDTATGKRLTRSDVLTLSDEEFNSILADALLRDYADALFDASSKEVVMENLSAIEPCCLVGEDGVHIIINQYDMAPYAAGPLMVDLLYADYPDLLQEAYAK